MQNAGAPPPWQQPQPPVGKPTPLFPSQHDEPPPPPPPPSHQPSQLHGEEGEGREGGEHQEEVNIGHKTMEDTSGKELARMYMSCASGGIPLVILVVDLSTL